MRVGQAVRGTCAQSIPHCGPVVCVCVCVCERVCVYECVQEVCVCVGVGGGGGNKEE